MTPIVVALIIAIFLKTCIFANIVIPTGSMLNTIQEGDRIIASRLAYINDEPQRYDIIIFKYPDDETQLFAKRIIALPGETIEVKNGIVYITDKNGNKSTARTDFITNCIPTGNLARIQYRSAVILLWEITEMTVGIQGIGITKQLKKEKS